ncbi:MAG TPA: SRPBCC domain-containing protein [Fibrobacteria bacterium]|nr:SRPBCC domain-containing protein [Fibrobacteria bacterium]
MSKRIDSASRFIPASPSAVYAAFADPGAMEQWVPPKNMTATMLHFDFREGGSYRMRLTYKNAEDGRGKTSDNADEVEVRLVKLLDATRIEQAVTFESDDPEFSGVMRMTWTLDPTKNGTLVTVRAEDVPRGIRPEDHEAGMNSTLDNLVSFLGGEPRG